MDKGMRYHQRMMKAPHGPAKTVFDGRNTDHACDCGEVFDSRQGRTLHINGWEQKKRSAARQEALRV